jgi:hypothetical protein
MSELDKPKSEHEKLMEKRMYDIDVRIAEILAEGRTPEYFICNPRTIEEILNSYCDEQLVKAIDWKQSVAFAFANGEINLVILRTMDMKYGDYLVF